MINSKVVAAIIIVLVAIHLTLDLRTTRLDTTKADLDSIRIAVNEVTHRVDENLNRNRIYEAEQKLLHDEIARIQERQSLHNVIADRLARDIRSQLDSTARVQFDSLIATHNKQIADKDSIINRQAAIILSKDVQIAEKDSLLMDVTRRINTDITAAVNRIEQNRPKSKLSTIITIGAIGLAAGAVLAR